MCNDNWNRSGFTHTLQVVAVRGQRLWYSLLMSAQNDWKIPFLKTCKKHLLCVWNDFPNDIYCFSLPLLKIPVRILHNKYIITVEVNIQQINVRQGQNDSMYATGNGWKQQHGFRVSVLLLTGNLCHHCLRDPPVPQERFDLLFHHAAVPPANTHTSKHTVIHLYTLSAGKSQDTRLVFYIRKGPDHYSMDRNSAFTCSYSCSVAVMTKGYMLGRILKIKCVFLYWETSKAKAPF